MQWITDFVDYGVAEISHLLPVGYKIDKPMRPKDGFSFRLLGLYRDRDASGTPDSFWEAYDRLVQSGSTKALQ